MDPLKQYLQHSRREFLTTSASGIGGLALASLLHRDGLGATDSTTKIPAAATNPLAPRLSHFAPKAKRCIFIFLACPSATSQGCGRVGLRQQCQVGGE